MLDVTGTQRTSRTTWPHDEPWPRDTPVYRTGYEVQFELTAFDCPCDRLTVRQYWYAPSEGGFWTDADGGGQFSDLRSGPKQYPEGMTDTTWKWIPGDDGFVTDSVDTDPAWPARRIECDEEARVAAWTDRPEMILPVSLAEHGLWGMEYYFKTDVLCDGEVFDSILWMISLKWQPDGSGSLSNVSDEFLKGSQVQLPPQ